MIFVTVGTHQQPFQRLLDALDAFDPAELVVQHGPGRPPVGVRRATPYLPFNETLAAFEEAEKVIMHAGVGSVLCARRVGHVPIIVPRRHDLGEHVDEHQAELTRALAQHGAVIPVWEAEKLAELTAEAPPRGKGVDDVDVSLTGAVRTALLGPAS